MKKMTYQFFCLVFVVVFFNYCYSNWAITDLSANLGVNLDSAFNVTCCLNNSNQAVVSWADYDGTSYYTRAATFDGISWKITDLKAHKDAVTSVTCRLNESGKALVSWVDEDSNYHYVQAAIFDGISWITYVIDVIAIVSPVTNIGNLTCSFNESNQAVLAWAAKPSLTFDVKGATFDGFSWHLYNLITPTAQVWGITCNLNEANQALISCIYRDVTPPNYFFVEAFTFTFGSTSWTTHLLSTFTLTAGFYLTASLNESNQAVVSWQGRDISLNEHAQAAIYDGLSWATQDLANTVNVYNVTCCLNEAGQVLVSWRDTDGTNFYARAATYDGLSWATQDLANTVNVYDVTCCLNEASQAVVSWSDYDGTNHYAKAATYNGSSWNTHNLNANPYDVFNVSCCLNESNQAVVSWIDQDSTTSHYFHVQAATYNGSSWNTTDLTANLTVNLTNAKNVNCCLNELGQAVVSWADEDGSNHYARAATYNGSSWTIADLNANPYKVEEISCCLNKFNQALVSWFDRDNTINHYYHIKAAIYSEPFVSLGRRGPEKDLLLQRDCVNELTWNNIAAARRYRVYLNSLDDLVFEGSKLSFFHHGAARPSTYYITWIGINGIESTPLVVQVP